MGGMKFAFEEMALYTGCPFAALQTDHEFAMSLKDNESPGSPVTVYASELDELLNECGFGSPTVTTVLSARNRALPFSFLLRSSDVV